MDIDMKRLCLAVAAIAISVAGSILSPADASATTWSVVPGESRIGFSGSHAGKAFKGTFERWQADITFDPANLSTAKATVSVALSSAKTGDTTYDKTLPTVDWFDIAKTPSGVFETTAFRSVGGDKYEADGSLDVRGFKVPVKLAFEFKTNGDTAKLTGKTQLKRLDFGIGKGSDAPGEWVSLDIPIDVSVSLKKS